MKQKQNKEAQETDFTDEKPAKQPSDQGRPQRTVEEAPDLGDEQAP